MSYAYGSQRTAVHGGTPVRALVLYLLVVRGVATKMNNAEHTYTDGQFVITNGGNIGVVIVKDKYELGLTIMLAARAPTPLWYWYFEIRPLFDHGPAN